jgi:hypothetical protein
LVSSSFHIVLEKHFLNKCFSKNMGWAHPSAYILSFTFYLPSITTVSEYIYVNVYVPPPSPPPGIPLPPP